MYVSVPTEKQKIKNITKTDALCSLLFAKEGLPELTITTDAGRHDRTADSSDSTVVTVSLYCRVRKAGCCSKLSVGRRCHGLVAI